MVMRNTQLETMEEGGVAAKQEIFRRKLEDQVQLIMCMALKLKRKVATELLTNLLPLPPHHRETIGRGLLLPRRRAPGEIRRPAHSQAGTISSRTINLNKVFTQY